MSDQATKDQKTVSDKERLRELKQAATSTAKFVAYLVALSVFTLSINVVISPDDTLTIIAKVAVLSGVALTAGAAVYYTMEYARILVEIFVLKQRQND